MKLNVERPPVVRASEDQDMIYVLAEIAAGRPGNEQRLIHWLNAGRRLLEKKRELAERTGARPIGWKEWLDTGRLNQKTADRHVRYAESVESVFGVTVTPKTDELEPLWDESAALRSDPKPSAPVPPQPKAPSEPSKEPPNAPGDKQTRQPGAPDGGGPKTDPPSGPATPTFPRMPLPQAPTDPPGPRRKRRIGKPGEYVLLDSWSKMSAPEQVTLLGRDGKSRFNDQETDSIEWALRSWNPVTGCKHDCPYCYARDIANRFYTQRFETSLWPNRLTAPRHTPFPADEVKDAASADPVHALGLRNVFVCSMADLFGRWVPKEWIDAVLAECRSAAQWNFLFLTKFPNRMSEFVFPDNAWVGTTVDCQARVRNAEKSFRKVRAKFKWLSCEPLIEPLHFTDIGAFHWVVVGGGSRSVKTPEWRPPRQWVVSLEAAAWAAGCKVYEKTNLYPHGYPDDLRVREYPGLDTATVSAPASMVYLPTDIA